MKAPMTLPFVKRGEDVPPTGVTVQAVLGFFLPFILILVTALLAYFIIRAGIGSGDGEAGVGAAVRALAVR